MACSVPCVSTDVLPLKGRYSGVVLEAHMLVKRCFIFTIFVLVSVIFLCAGCGDDKAGYEGVGRLVADRNRARLAKDRDQKVTPDSSSSSKARAKNSPGEVLVEEDVMIVISSSGRLLAEGTAYLDENGKIVNIRIIK